MPTASDCTGVILAGGKSSRFGSNKALTEMAGKKLIEYPAAVLGDLFPDRLLITNAPEEYAFLGWPMTGDIYRESGPLAGIHAAMRAAATPLIFVVGCDMPFLEKTLIRYLCSLAGKDDVVIPRSARGLEPLHAVYHCRIIEALERCLERGERQIRRAISALKIREVYEEELLAIGAKADSFRNLNFPADLDERK